MHKNVKLLLIASILIHSGANLLAPIYAIFIKEVGGDLIDAGIAVGIYALLKGVFYFLFARVKEDFLSKKWMMFIGYTIMGLGYGAYIFANKPMHVFVIQGALSLGETIINPSWSAIIATSLQKGKERHLYAHFYGYRSLFEGGAALLGGVFAVKFGFNLVFGIMVGFAIASGFLSLLIEENISKE